MTGCTWKITRLSGGFDRFHNSRHCYILGDRDRMPGPKGKSFPTESGYFSEAQALAAVAFSMGGCYGIHDMLKFWDEDPTFQKLVKAYIKKAYKENRLKHKDGNVQ